jgi:uncharacterized protein DUF4878
MRLLKLTVLLAALAGVLAFTGCGDSDEDQIKSNVEDLVQALADGDGAAACELITSDQRDEIGEGENQSCEDYVAGQSADLDDAEKEALRNTEVVGVKIEGDEADVDVKTGDDEDELDLRKEDGEWRFVDIS